MHSWRNTLFTVFLLMLMISFMGVCVQLYLVENEQAKSEVYLQELPVDLTPTAIRPTVSAQIFFPIYVIDSGFDRKLNKSLVGQTIDKDYFHHSGVSQIPKFLSHRVLRI